MVQREVHAPVGPTATFEEQMTRNQHVKAIL